MTHNWPLGRYEVAPGLTLRQHLYGGPSHPDEGDPRLVEHVVWSLVNEELADGFPRLDQRRYAYAELAISREHAETLLKAAGYTTDPVKAGLTRIDTIMATKPDTEPWEVAEDFQPEAFEAFKARESQDPA